MKLGGDVSLSFDNAHKGDDALALCVKNDVAAFRHALQMSGEFRARSATAGEFRKNFSAITNTANGVGGGVGIIRRNARMNAP